MIITLEETPENHFIIGYEYADHCYEREIAIEFEDHAFMSISEQLIENEDTYLQYIYLHDKKNEKVILRIDYFTIDNVDETLSHNGFDIEEISHVYKIADSDYGSLSLMNDIELQVPNEIIDIIKHIDESMLDFSDIE